MLPKPLQKGERNTSINSRRVVDTKGETGPADETDRYIKGTLRQLDEEIRKLYSLYNKTQREDSFFVRNFTAPGLDCSEWLKEGTPPARAMQTMADYIDSSLLCLDSSSNSRQLAVDVNKMVVKPLVKLAVMMQGEDRDLLTDDTLYSLEGIRKNLTEKEIKVTPDFEMLKQPEEQPVAGSRQPQTFTTALRSVVAFFSGPTPQDARVVPTNPSRWCDPGHSSDGEEIEEESDVRSGASEASTSAALPPRGGCG